MATVPSKLNTCECNQTPCICDKLDDFVKSAEFDRLMREAFERNAQKQGNVADYNTNTDDNNGDKS